MFEPELINFVWFVIPFTLSNNRGLQDFVRLLPGGLIGIDRLELTQGGPTFDDPAEDRVLAIKVGVGRNVMKNWEPPVSLPRGPC